MNDTDNAMGVLLTETLFAQALKGTLVHVKSASFKLDENMEALQHSFPLKRFFKKKNKTEEANK
jgi:phospholipid/cholesterol/gamma-HCH transport system substrate-binding protein